jgi:hypothetical protein
MAGQYREINSVYEGYLGQVWNAEDAEAILGGASLANPLGLAVQMATLAAPGTLVYFTSPKGTTATKFKEALDFLIRSLYFCLLHCDACAFLLGNRC